MAEDRKQRQNRILVQTVSAIVLGLGAAIALGVALDSVWWGIFFGVAMALVFFGAMSWTRRR